MTARRAWLVAAALLLLPTCSADGGGEEGSGSGDRSSTTTADDRNTTTTPDDDDPDRTLIDAVDSTLALDSFGFETTTALSVDRQTYRLASEGAVDYAELIADAELSVEGGGQDSTVSMRADGTKLWLKPGGRAAAGVPAATPWIEGRAAQLETSENFTSSDLIGVILALRATDGAEAGERETIDGAETTAYTTTGDFDDAVEAAGDDADAFRSALTITSPTPVDLDIEAWVDGDGIIRRFRLTLDGGRAPLTGTYDVALNAVDETVEPPAAPPASQIFSGPKATALLATLLGT